jgi:DNA polymerase III epsilon subunit-like protein
MESSIQLEPFISVDVETAGPSPGQYSLLSIGACTISSPQQTFYVELQPLNDLMQPEAYAIHGLSLEELRQQGVPPKVAMERFDAWLLDVLPEGSAPIFLAFNAPFDWSFVNEYFHRYLGRNPFGHAALDIKAFYMGVTGSSWQDTNMRNVSNKYLAGRKISHNALEDALDQAKIFLGLLRQSRQLPDL